MYPFQNVTFQSEIKTMQSHGHSPMAYPAVVEEMTPVVLPPAASTPVMDEGDAIILEEDELEEDFIYTPNEDLAGKISASSTNGNGTVFITRYPSDPTLDESSSLDERFEEYLTDASELTIDPELTMFRKDSKKETKHPHYCYCRRVRVSSYGGARNRYPCRYIFYSPLII